MGLTKHQEGWEKGGAHRLDMHGQKLVRRTGSLALAIALRTSLIDVRFQLFCDC